MVKRKRQPKRSADGKSPPPKRRKRKSTLKATAKEEEDEGRYATELQGDVTSSTSRSEELAPKSDDGGSNRKRTRGTVRFATEDGDELETAKTRLFGLRQAKADMQSSLHKFQQQVKCLNEEIEELHEKLERLVARHTREQVEECTNRDALRNSYRNHVRSAAKEGARNSEIMARPNAEAKEYLRKCQDQLKTLNRDIDRYQTWKELIKRRRGYMRPEKDGEERGDRKGSNESDESYGSSVKSEGRAITYGGVDDEYERAYKFGSDSECERAKVHTIYSRDARMPSYSDTSNCTSYTSLYDTKAERREDE